MLSGHIYDGDSLLDSKRILTWHDEDPFRFWVASYRGDSGSQVIQSFEVQILQPKGLRPSNEELRARLKLVGNQIDSNRVISASEFRKLPLGEILIERADLLMATMQRESRRKDKVVLLKDFGTNTVRQSNSKPPKGFSVITGANSDDAVLIAKIYVDQCNMSTVRAAQRTAEYLKIETKLVHVALKIARRNKWLTSSGSGKAGGQLTDRGETEFALSNGPMREKLMQKRRGLN